MYYKLVSTVAVDSDVMAKKHILPNRKFLINNSSSKMFIKCFPFFSIYQTVMVALVSDISSLLATNCQSDVLFVFLNVLKKIFFDYCSRALMLACFKTIIINDDDWRSKRIFGCFKFNCKERMNFPDRKETTSCLIVIIISVIWFCHYHKFIGK